MAPSGLSAAEFVALVERAGVRLQLRGASVVRVTTHYGVTRADVDTAVRVIGRALKEAGRPAGISGLGYT